MFVCRTGEFGEKVTIQKRDQPIEPDVWEKSDYSILKSRELLGVRKKIDNSESILSLRRLPP